MAKLFDLRPHQVSALDGLRGSLRSGNRRPMLQLPTGAGKTVIAAHIVHGAKAKAKRVTFCVPALSLIDQTFERFVANGINPGDMGVIQGDHPWRRPAAPIQIASVQTLRRRGMPDTGLLVVDEAHIRDAWLHAYLTSSENASLPVVGLSATPWSAGLGKIYDDLVKPVSMRELIDQGYLSKFRVFAPSHPDLEGVKTVAGDFHEGDLADRMSKPQIVADIVSTWMAKGHGLPTLCFCVNRAHARLVHDQFAAEGIRVAYIDANTPREEREEIGRRLAAGDIEVVCNIGTLTTGIDWDVRCLILARPTKSDALFVQIIGRALRTAEGKDCLARGSLVLTDKGLVKIENVTLDHKVWDGVNFVRHAGAICKGVQPVITHDGVTATREHLVMTNEGWKTIETAHRLGLWIARTGMGSAPVRLSDDCFGQGGRINLQPARGSRVRKVWAAAYGAIPQHTQTPQHGGVPALQRPQASHCSEVALSALSRAAEQVLQSSCEWVRGIRRAWDRISFQRPERSGGVDCGEFGRRGSVDDAGSDRRGQALRAWEFALGRRDCSAEQYDTKQGRSGYVRENSHRSSGSEIRGSHAEKANPSWHDGGRDHCSVGDAFVQAEREVWDIHDAGPLQRFTANGRLVHNCALILDHSDTHLRLGMVDEIDHDSLSNGKPKKNGERESEKDRLPLPWECTECGALAPAGVKECPNCGHVRKPRIGVDNVDGELSELTRNRKARRKGESAADSLARMGKQQIYSQLLSIRAEKGAASGWAAHKYREIFGVFPRNLIETRSEPSFELRSFIRSRDIAWAKSKKREVAA